jgi:hypothetical protein
MLHQGASLSEIGDLLGHRHPQTTKIYTKVDIQALRALALPWPGGRGHAMVFKQLSGARHRLRDE